MAKASGTGYARIRPTCSGANNVTTCSCVRSDGGTCTASAATVACNVAVANLGTTPVRLSAVFSCTSATTSIDWGLIANEGSVSVGTTRFSGAQLEVGTYPTSLIVTTTTATARNADAVSATVPAVPIKWCIAVTAKPEEGSSLILQIDSGLWALPNIANVANSAYQKITGPIAYPVIVDASATGIYRTVGHGITTSTSRWVSCFAPGTTPTLTIDSVLKAGHSTGAGLGFMATPSTVLSFGPDSFGGYLKNLRICKATKQKECP